MNLGISTACLYPRLTEDSLNVLIKCGYKNFELFINAHSEIEIEYLKELKNIAISNGVKFDSLHPFECLLEAMMFFSDYERRFDESCEKYKRYFEACAYLGANVFVFHGEHRGKYGGFCGENARYFERYLKLYEIARQFDVYLCQENVQFYRGETVEFIDDMKKNLKDDCKFVFDIKQARHAKQDSFKMIEAMGNSLMHVHLSDCLADKLCIVPGEGNFDFYSLFSQLKKQGFDRTICTEVYSSSIKSSENLTKSKDFLGKFF